MEHKHEGKIPAILAAVLFALAVSMLLVLSHSFIKFTGVQNVRYENGMIYGVNINKTRNELFAMNADTGEGQFLKINQMGRDGVTSFPALEVTEDGTVYLVRERYRDGEVNSMDLVKWDLKTNRLETVWEIPYDNEGDLIGFEVKDNRWYFLFYTESASETAYELTSVGRYYKLDSSAEIVWDNGISGIAISSLPFKGVHKSTGIIAAYIILIMLAVLIIEFLLWIFSVWWKSRALKYRSLIRMLGFTTAAFVILITAFNVFMKTAVFNYVSTHKIYSCEVEAEVLSETIDHSFLDNLANGSIDADSSEVQHILGNHWSMFTGVAVHRDGNLVLEGDLFSRGRAEEVLSDGSLKELIDKTFKSGERMSTIYAARRGANALVLLPVKTESGNETVICVRAPLRNALYEAYIIRKHITRICYAILGGILIITIVQVIWGQASIGKLRWALDELAAGRFDARADVHGLNELAYASKEFDRMAEQLEEKQGGADLYRRFYEAFLPMNLLKKITNDQFQPSFKAGSSTEAEAIFLSISIPADVSEEADRRSAVLSSLVQIVDENSGSVVEFRDDGIAAVFTDAVKDVLLCALKLQRKMQENTGKSAFMGMTVGTVSVSVDGCEQRREIQVKKSAEADILSELSKMLNNALIVSGESAASLITEESGFHFRELGRMSLGEYSSSGELYALMDAELPDVRSKRERTLPDFEKGVRAYASGDYFTAREQMICCLLDDPDDRTARSYCLNCERKEPPAICEAVR